MIYLVVGLVVACALLAGLVVMLFRRLNELSASIDAMSDEVESLRTQTIPLLADTRSALRRADSANRKSDALLEVATSLTATADSATKLAFRLVTNPVVKVVAFFTGTTRAAKRLAEITSPTPQNGRVLSGHTTTRRPIRARQVNRDRPAALGSSQDTRTKSRRFRGRSK